MPGRVKVIASVRHLCEIPILLPPLIPRRTPPRVFEAHPELPHACFGRGGHYISNPTGRAMQLNVNFSRAAAG